MLGMHMGRVPAACAWEESGESRRVDTCDWIDWINRASIVANVESGLIEKPLARRIAAALDDFAREAEAPGAVRPELYITFEPEILKRAGMAASVLHVGRSSQDILATANAGLNLGRLTRLLAAAHEVVDALLKTARREIDALVPAYTNGVQAQPTLWSHYLHAVALSFLRDCARIRECISRHDVCPMGSCVCNGTGWPLNSARMAELLGFSRPARNAFDAGQICGNDMPLEISQIVTSLMIHATAPLADFMTQYAAPHPWFRFKSANGVYRSSAMPQKRNPGLINDCRRDSGLVMSASQGVLLRLQNLPYGMADARDARIMEALADDACVVLRTLAGIISSLEVDRERALAELNADWTASQEIADRLVRVGGVDFRSGHRFASRLVGWAREAGVTPKTLQYADACRIWTEFQPEAAQAGTELPSALPLEEAVFMDALDPMGILNARATAGSANPQNMKYMLDSAEADASLVALHVKFLRDSEARMPLKLREALEKTLAE